MNKIKNWLWKTFFPVSYNVHLLNMYGDSNPTVNDLLLLQAKDNERNRNLWTKAFIRKFYRDWINSIQERNDLKTEDSGFTCNNKFEFETCFEHFDNPSIRDGMQDALDWILSHHPDMTFTQKPVKSSEMIIKFNYSNCLRDPIDLNNIADDSLLKFIDKWKEKRNH